MKLSFLLLLFSHLTLAPTAFAQTTKKSNKVYLVLFYVKILDAQHHEYVRGERRIQAPIQQEVVNTGKMISWSLYWVETSSDYTRDYDFVSVKAYRNLKDIDIETPDAFKKAHPGKNRDSLVLPLFKMRESPRREIWVVEEQVAEELTGKSNATRMLVNFSSSRLNARSMYQKLVADSVIKNWESYVIFLPQGHYPYYYLSLCTFDKYESLEPILQVTAATMKSTNQKSGNNPPSTNKQEMWWKWAGTK